MLSDVRRKKLTHLFHLCDSNDDGFLEKADYENIAKRLAAMFNWDLDSDIYRVMLNAQLFDWEEIQKAADANHDNQVTLDEYLAAYDKMPDASIHENIDNTIYFAFGWFDKDKDGSIQVDEYERLLSLYNVETVSAQTAFGLLDTNGDGKLSEQELKTALRDFFLSDDASAQGNHFWGEIE